MKLVSNTLSFTANHIPNLPSYLRMSAEFYHVNEHYSGNRQKRITFNSDDVSYIYFIYDINRLCPVSPVELHIVPLIKLLHLFFLAVHVTIAVLIFTVVLLSLTS